MVKLFEHPLFLALVGLTFSLGFGPWLVRRWQDHQRDRDIRMSLIADMSRCVMSLVAVLERQHPGTARDVTPDRSNDDKLANAVSTFEVDRCVIGTKLEVYYPGAGEADLAPRWTVFADELIRFSGASRTLGEGDRNEPNRKELACTLNQFEGEARAAACERASWVDEKWGESEQLFMLEKLSLLREVRTKLIAPSAAPPRTFGIWLLWSFIALLATCVALVGKDRASVLNQPIVEMVFVSAALVSASLTLVLLLKGLVVRSVGRRPGGRRGRGSSPAPGSARR